MAKKKETHCLVKLKKTEEKKYNGKWVATRGFGDNETIRNKKGKIVADKDMTKLVERLAQMGISDPVIVFITQTPLCPSYWPAEN